MPFKDKETALRWQRKYNKTHYKKHTEQYKAIQKNRRIEIKKWFREYKSTLSCEKCPENFALCLDFHHKDPTDKVLGISEMVVNGFGKENILAEIEKCIVLCKNCHAKHHYLFGPVTQCIE